LAASAEPSVARPAKKAAAPAPIEEAAPPLVTAMSLFTDPAVHEVATENLMRAGQASALTRNADGTLTERTVELLLPEERQMVFEIVEAGFRNIGIELRRQAPGMAGELDRIGLEVRDQDALLSMLLLMSDTRVQRLGLAVARVIRAAPEETPELLVDEVLQEGALALYNYTQAASGQWDRIVMPKMRITSVNGIIGDMAAMKGAQ